MNPYDVWAEIDLTAISNNIGQLMRLLDGATRFMAVVKADAYGHGAAETARTALGAGADAFGVARLGEAVALRHADIAAPILIFGKTRPEHAGKLVAYDLTQSVGSYAEASALAARARAMGAKIRVHAKIDTGMGRLGIAADGRENAAGPEKGFRSGIDTVCAIWELEGLACEGIYTHFSSADDPDRTMTRRQLFLFNEMTRRLEARGVHFPVRHAANSAALIGMPETHLDMVRAGIAVYGYDPRPDPGRKRVALTPSMTLKARIIHLKSVGAGFPVSYGASERTGTSTTVASVAVGYADGYPRLLSSAGAMAVRGIPAPVIGRVCMDMTMIDVGGVPGAAEGDTVTVFGNPAQGAPGADRVAEQTGTVSYEVLTGVSGRVPRIYHGFP